VKGLGAHVIGVRRAGTAKPAFVDALCLSDKIDGLLPRADIVGLFLPATDATRHLLSRERLALMKDDSYILNAGRGNAIDQEALCDAMDAGKFAGAGLDVTDPEPLPPDHRLWKTPRVFLTPHVAGTDAHTVTDDRVVKSAARNIAAYLSGGAPQNVIDPATGYRALPAEPP
jgi:phosphoglycerate dehydrogenase-like enzyme